MKRILIITIFTFLFISSFNIVNAQSIINVDGLGKVKIGSSIQLHAWKINDCSNDTNCKYNVNDVTTDAIWTSSNENIASISKIGLVTGKKEGQILIKATYNDNGKTLSSTKSIIITKEDNNEKGNYGYFLNLNISGKKINYNIGDKVIISPFFCSYLNEKRTEVTTDGPVLIESSKVKYKLSDNNLANISTNGDNNFVIEFKKEGDLSAYFSYNWGSEKYSSKVNFRIISNKESKNNENNNRKLVFLLVLLLVPVFWIIKNCIERHINKM